MHLYQSLDEETRFYAVNCDTFSALQKVKFVDNQFLQTKFNIGRMEEWKNLSLILYITLIGVFQQFLFYYWHMWQQNYNSIDTPSSFPHIQTVTPMTPSYHQKIQTHNCEHATGLEEHGSFSILKLFNTVNHLT